MNQTTQCQKHKIGNWYSYKDKPYILSNVSGKVVLINTDGDFYSVPVLYLNRTDITQETFDLACGSASGKFKRIEVDVKVVHRLELTLQELAEVAPRDILINALKEELKRSNKQLYKMVYALGSALDGQQHHEVHELGLTYADCELVWESLSEARRALRENNWISPDEYNLKEQL